MWDGMEYINLKKLVGRSLVKEKWCWVTSSSVLDNAYVAA